VPELAWCVALEWGWWFCGPALLIAFAVLVWLAILVVRDVGTLSVSYEKIKVIAKGNGAVGVVVTAAIIGLIIYGVILGYRSLKDSYLVALSTPGRELEQIRNDFQGETHVEISIKDSARKFVVSGSYRGACVPDLFEAICRQYASHIICRSSSWKQTLIVDQKSP
jgi:hypothetical protein